MRSLQYCWNFKSSQRLGRILIRRDKTWWSSQMKKDMVMILISVSATSGTLTWRHLRSWIISHACLILTNYFTFLKEGKLQSTRDTRGCCWNTSRITHKKWSPFNIRISSLGRFRSTLRRSGIIVPFMNGWKRQTVPFPLLEPVLTSLNFLPGRSWLSWSGKVEIHTVSFRPEL